MHYEDWFKHVTNHCPHKWQAELAQHNELSDRLIRIPTGFGKTIGVGAVWFFHAVVRKDSRWPRRLVWCLPSRVLVEQTADALGSLFTVASAKDELSTPSVHVLMGGEEIDEWHLAPGRPAALVGTQDMLLSRALGRGYASGRARWPIEFGLLNQDCLWVIDEVQLHGVGLPTSIQLQTFRGKDAGRGRLFRPVATWWMSATLQPDWLNTVDAADNLPALCDEMLEIRPKDRSGPLWEAAKPRAVESMPGKIKDPKLAASWAEYILALHAEVGASGGHITLVIVNRVDSAIAIYAAIAKQIKGRPDAPELRLVHSRFRGRERKKWADSFLSRAACEEHNANRIIISTQVVEAGVDVSATTLVTEIAPWPSLVQRFGRAARYGGTARVAVIDPEADAKDALPYEELDLQAAREALARLDNVSLKSLQQFEDRIRNEASDLLRRLYRFEYVHLLTARECRELFDTTPDVSGADLDVSRFIREDEDRDVMVCWFEPTWDWKETGGEPPPDRQPLRETLCPVPVGEARKWLRDSKRAGELAPHHAWYWDYVDSRWRQVRRAEDLVPGRVVLVQAKYGGYRADIGFTGGKPRKGETIDTMGVLAEPARPSERALLADEGQLREDLTESAKAKTIATHGGEVASIVQQLAQQLKLPDDVARVLAIAARWHDWGKAHAVFQANIEHGDSTAGRTDLAKAARWLDYRDPNYNWPERRGRIELAYGQRRGFRHELATALGILELVARASPQHPALLGQFAALVELGELSVVERDPLPEPSPLIDELTQLPANELNLMLYLVCSHHGKVRGVWQSTPHDQEFPFDDLKLVGQDMPICGVRDGDPLLGVAIRTAGGETQKVPDVVLHLDASKIGLNGRYGMSWTERVASLIGHRGVFTLALLEAILRAADVEASRMTTGDPLLELKTEVVQ